MKKHVLFVAAMFAASLTFAQSGEITSNRGENWLSESGDYAISFTATPFLGYFGNMFNGTPGNMAPVADFINDDMAIEGKKMIDSNTAYRGKFRLGFSSWSVDSIVPLIGSTSGETVEDKRKESSMNITLGAGMEKRVGNSRVVGVYGAEAYLMFGSRKTKWEYGNSLEDMGVQKVENKRGGTFGIGVGLFAGVEWFFAPKMSLGAEYTFGLGFSSTGTGSQTTDIFDNESQTTETGGGSGFGIDTGVAGSSNSSYSSMTEYGYGGADLKLTFYFQ